ncbi:MAG: hypothetical protein AAGB23_12000, partial [Pseudomonadota bacterium]
MSKDAISKPATDPETDKASATSRARSADRLDLLGGDGKSAPAAGDPIVEAKKAAARKMLEARAAEAIEIEERKAAKAQAQAKADESSE